MKTQKLSERLEALAAAAALFTCVANARAQGTAFTYQGRLTDGGGAATGSYDLSFEIFDASSGGSAVGNTVTNLATPITTGLFTVILDFGTGIFDGNARWLEIGVRTNGGSSFTRLVPRQPLTAMPYSLIAGDVTGPNIARLNVPNTSRTATGTPIVISGFITGATVTSGGLGYSTAPPVTVNDTTGSGAVVSATISNGMVVSLTVLTAGQNYSSGTKLSIGPPASNAFQVFSGTNFFTGLNDFSNPNNLVAGIFTGTFNGNGAGLSNLVSAWQITGNMGTSPTNSNFLGTIDNQPLELRVNGVRAMRLEPTATNGAVNVVGGSSGNFVSRGAVATTIGGGGAVNYAGFARTNGVESDFGTIAGGGDNLIDAQAMNSVIGGGFGNAIQQGSQNATIAGGQFNLVATNAGYSFIGGGTDQSIGTNAFGSTIAGGQGNSIGANATYGAIGGGTEHVIETNAGSSTIGGGQGNVIRASSSYSVIGGGALNQIQPRAQFSIIGGGEENQIGTNAWYATVPGGLFNIAGANYSFAAGQQAQALHFGTFVWADSLPGPFASTGADQFLVRARGGVGINKNNPATALDVNGTVTANGNLIANGAGIGITAPAASLHVVGPGQTVALVESANTTGTWLGLGNTSTGGQRWSLISTGAANGEGAGRLLFFDSAVNARRMMLDSSGNLTIQGTLSQGSDRHSKTALEPINPLEVLDKVSRLPMTRWAYTNDTSVRHLGPMAQDFYAAFGLGADDRHIAALDEEGVALAAVQGLNEKLEQKEARIRELEARLEKLERLVSGKLEH